jgi:hypothetical protein
VPDVKASEPREKANESKEMTSEEANEKLREFPYHD